MGLVTKFLGEGQSAGSAEEAIFKRLFFAGAIKDLCIIKSRLPIPFQDISSQHFHNNFEFTIPLSHSPRLLIDNKQFTLPRRYIFPSNPGQYHGPAEIARHNRIIALQISPSELKEVSSLLFGKRSIEFQNIPVPLDLRLENLIEMFIYESQNKQAGHKFILEHLSSLLGAAILRTLKSNLDLQEKRFNGISKKEIDRALDYLHTNINQDFSLDSVAELVGLSKYHFLRVFKLETGKITYHYFIDIKIEKAIGLIKAQKYTITEICFMCGFKDHSHFSRVFRSKTGFTPTQYKNMCM